MKIISISLMSLLFSLSAFADSSVASIQNKMDTTNTVTHGTLSGDLVAIKVDVTGVTTGTLSVVSGRTGETIYTNSAVTADVVVRPRVFGNLNTGAVLGTTTNLPERFYLANDTLTITLSDTAPTTNTYSLTFITK